MNRLTLCTIVRNEEAMLADCLASVRGVVDRIVVVDTGSTDRTVQIAEAAGALVVHYEWNDDFSAARNAAIAQVQDGYVLMLDADERLSADAGKAIKHAVQEGRIDGARLSLHNANSLEATHEEVLSGAARIGSPILMERLLRRTPDLAWEGVVHEHVTRWALKGRLIVTLEASIVHYGAIPELRVRLGKSERNIKLLRKACKQDPENVVFRTCLAQELALAGNGDEMGEHVEAAWKSLCKLHEQGKPAPDSTPTATLRALLLMRDDRRREAKETLAKASAWDGEHPNLLYFGAVIESTAWDNDSSDEANLVVLDKAEKACMRVIELKDKAYQASVIPGLVGWLAYTHVGIARILKKDPEGALDAFEVALQAKPHHLDARLGFAEALILGGQAGPALEVLAPILHPDIPDGWVLAAWAGYQFGGYAEVATFVEQARQAMATQPLLAQHRNWILEELEAEAAGEVAA